MMTQGDNNADLWRRIDELNKLSSAMLTALENVCDAQREAVRIVNNQGAAFPSRLAVACEKARAAIAQAKEAGIK